MSYTPKHTTYTIECFCYNAREKILFAHEHDVTEEITIVGMKKSIKFFAEVIDVKKTFDMTRIAYYRNNDLPKIKVVFYADKYNFLAMKDAYATITSDQ